MFVAQHAMHLNATSLFSLKQCGVREQPCQYGEVRNVSRTILCAVDSIELTICRHNRDAVLEYPM